MTDEQVTGDQIVLTFQWRDTSGLIRSDTFGPWIPDEHETHVAAIEQFVRDWNRLSGVKPDVVTMAIAFDPAEWVRQQEARVQQDQACIERGVVPASEVREMRHGGSDG